MLLQKRLEDKKEQVASINHKGKERKRKIRAEYNEARLRSQGKWKSRRPRGRDMSVYPNTTEKNLGTKAKRRIIERGKSPHDRTCEGKIRKGLGAAALQMGEGINDQRRKINSGMSKKRGKLPPEQRQELSRDKKTSEGGTPKNRMKINSAKKVFKSNGASKGNLRRR